MPTERERKFLVAEDAWREDATDSFPVRQGYLARTDRCAVRVRRLGDRAFLTVKGAGLRARAEYEWEIDPAEADEMLENLATGHVIEKRRHHVPFGGRVWEVDEFTAPFALVMAEIEFDEPDGEIALPPWVGEEVTDDPRYQNANLSAAGAPPDRRD